MNEDRIGNKSGSGQNTALSGSIVGINERNEQTREYTALYTCFERDGRDREQYKTCVDVCE